MCAPQGTAPPPSPMTETQELSLAPGTPDIVTPLAFYLALMFTSVAGAALTQVL